MKDYFPFSMKIAQKETHIEISLKPVTPRLKAILANMRTVPTLDFGMRTHIEGYLTVAMILGTTTIFILSLFIPLPQNILWGTCAACALLSFATLLWPFLRATPQKTITDSIKSPSSGKPHTHIALAPLLTLLAALSISIISPQVSIAIMALINTVSALSSYTLHHHSTKPPITLTSISLDPAPSRTRNSSSAPTNSAQNQREACRQTRQPLQPLE